MEPAFLFFLVFLGAVFLFVGAAVLFRQRRLERRCTAVTTGTVSAVEKEVTKDSDGDRCIDYYPVFRYVVDAQLLTQRSCVGTGAPRFSVGDTVEVRYDPECPEQYYVVEDRQGNRYGRICMIVGAVIIAALILASLS